MSKKLFENVGGNQFQLAQEAGEKFGKKKYSVLITKDFDSGMGTYKKGERVAVDGISDDGTPYVIAGHGSDIGFPPEYAKLITQQSQLPDELAKRFTAVKKVLNSLIKDKARYYNDVLTDEFVSKFVGEVKKQLDTLEKTKSPQREK